MNTVVSLRRIAFFIAVAEELHFGRAADRLAVSQPPLSQQIRKLESELGLKLFERNTRHVRLTDAGRILYPEAKRLLATARSVDRVAEELRSGQLGFLRLGFVDSAAYELVPRFLHLYRSRWPDVELDLRHMSSDEQIVALREHTLDLGIARASGDSTHVRSRIIANERLVVAVHARHRLAGSDDVHIGDLAGDRFVGFDERRSTLLHAELTALLDAHGVRYAPAVEATEYTTILGIVAAGEGIAVVPAGVRTFQPPGIHYVNIVESAASVRLVLLSRSEHETPFVGDSFDTIADDLRNIMRSLG